MVPGIHRQLDWPRRWAPSYRSAACVAATMPSPAPRTGPLPRRAAGQRCPGRARHAAPSITPRVMGSEVLPAVRRFSNVVLRAAGDQFLQGLQLGFVLLLDQRREADAGHRGGLGLPFSQACCSPSPNTRVAHSTAARATARSGGQAFTVRADRRGVRHPTPLTRLYPARVTSPTTLTAGWPRHQHCCRRPRAPSLPRLASACSMAGRHRAGDSLAQGHAAIGNLVQPIWPPAMSAIFSAIARQVSLERS